MISNAAGGSLGARLTSGPRRHRYRCRRREVSRPSASVIIETQVFSKRTDKTGSRFVSQCCLWNNRALREAEVRSQKTPEAPWAMHRGMHRRWRLSSAYTGEIQCSHSKPRLSAIVVSRNQRTAEAWVKMTRSTIVTWWQLGSR
jgi:hypothetical protein